VRTEDEVEFAGLVERQWRFAWRVAWAMLRNRQDAEDAAQEVFLRFLRAKAWRGLRDERAFVARAAWRAAVDKLRACRPQDRPDENLAETVQDDAPNPEAAMMKSNSEAVIHQLIDNLPEKLRQPLALSVEMNSREIAAAMGIPEGTVRTRLMRARQMLREKMTALEENHYARR
jgi:RNA polymerase sigma-70 factor (ECF subfamily)